MLLDIENWCTIEVVIECDHKNRIEGSCLMMKLFARRSGRKNLYVAGRSWNPKVSRGRLAWSLPQRTDWAKRSADISPVSPVQDLSNIRILRLRLLFLISLLIHIASYKTYTFQGLGRATHFVTPLSFSKFMY